MRRAKEQSISYKTTRQMREEQTAKQSTLKMLKRLRDDVTYEDIMSVLYVLEKIGKGLRELDEGRGIPHNEVKKRLSASLCVPCG